METRSKPNIMITGTPGTGKTHLCQQVAEVNPFLAIADHTLIENRISSFRCESISNGKRFLSRKRRKKGLLDHRRRSGNLQERISMN